MSTNSQLEASLSAATVLAAAVEPEVQYYEEDYRRSTLVNFKSANDSSKYELQRLNSQLEVYVEKTKQLEAFNQRLSDAVEQEKARKLPRIDFKEYESLIFEARNKLENESIECVRYEANTELNDSRKQEYMNRLRFYQAENEIHKQKTTKLLSILDDIAYEREFVLKSTKQAEQDILREQERMAHAENELDRLRRTLAENRYKNKKLEFELQTLQDEREFNRAVHEEETTLLKLSGKTLPPHIDIGTFYRNELLTAVREIRSDFHRLKDQQLDDLKHQRESELENLKVTVEKQVKARLIQSNEVVAEMNMGQMPEALNQNKVELTQLNAKYAEKLNRLKILESELTNLRSQTARALEQRENEINDIKAKNDLYFSEVDFWDRATRSKLESELQTYRSILNLQLKTLKPDLDWSKWTIFDTKATERPKVPDNRPNRLPSGIVTPIDTSNKFPSGETSIGNVIISTVTPVTPGNVIISSVSNDRNESSQVKPPSRPSTPPPLENSGSQLSNLIASTFLPQKKDQGRKPSIGEQDRPKSPVDIKPGNNTTSNSKFTQESQSNNNRRPSRPTTPPPLENTGSHLGNLIASTFLPQKKDQERKPSIGEQDRPKSPIDNANQNDGNRRPSTVLISNGTTSSTNQISSGKLSQDFLNKGTSGKRPSTVKIAGSSSPPKVSPQSEKTGNVIISSVFGSDSKVSPTQPSVVQERRPSEKSSGSNQSYLRRVFDTFDKDRSGYIDANEFAAIFKALNIQMSNAEFLKFLRDADLDRSRAVDFAEFSRLMEPVVTGSFTREELLNAFNYFDKDKSGFISVRELGQVLSQFGHTYSDNQIANMISKVDKNNDGRLNFEEFYTLMTRPLSDRSRNTSESGKVTPRDRKSVTLLTPDSPKTLTGGRYPLSSSKRDALRNIFDRFDRDKSGRINSSELTRILQSLDLNVNETTANQIIRDADVNYSRDIDFEEFCRIMAPAFEGTLSRDELFNAFHNFDKDDSGYISVRELSQVLSAVGQTHTESQIAAMIARVDKNFDGRLNFEEFVKLLSTPK